MALGHRWSIRAVVVLLLALTGCGGRLRVQHVDSTQDKPGNVWVMLSVEQGDQPVGGLTAEDFHVYEDGKLVSQADSKQVIQDADAVSASHTLLLIDISGGAGTSGRAALLEATRSFSERVAKTQRIGVYAFDGSEKLHPVAPLTEAWSADRLEQMRALEPRDPSTNLHGAVVEALRELTRSLDADPRPIKLGTLVVFSQGADRASRVSADVMKKELDDERYRHYRLYAVGLGATAKAAPLGRIGRDGHQLIVGEASLGGAFEQLAGRIEAQRQRMYLLSYCTPARGGEHAVRIEARTRGEQPRAGSARTKFVADGFGTPPECDPQARPRFAGNVRVKPETLPAAEAATTSGEQENDSKAAVGAGAGAKPQRPRGAAKRDPNFIDWKPSETR